jgi:hypothetical protein
MLLVGFIGDVTLISSAPMTPSHLILFKIAMRMSLQRRGRFTAVLVGLMFWCVFSRCNILYCVLYFPHFLLDVSCSCLFVHNQSRTDFVRHVFRKIKIHHLSYARTTMDFQADTTLPLLYSPGH